MLSILTSSQVKRPVLICFSILNLFFFSEAHAWSKAIFPFNTPYMVSKQICNNSKGWAKAAYHCHNGDTRKDLMDHLEESEGRSIQDDDYQYKEWHLIYRNEMARYIKIVWNNPNIDEDMAVKIVENDCNSRRELIKKSLEDSKP
jgi:hypothetical protein